MSIYNKKIETMKRRKMAKLQLKRLQKNDRLLY